MVGRYEGDVGGIGETYGRYSVLRPVRWPRVRVRVRVTVRVRVRVTVRVRVRVRLRVRVGARRTTRTRMSPAVKKVFDCESTWLG